MRNPTKLERRHFELIAKTLKYVKPHATDVDASLQWQCTVYEFISACKSSNGRFDRDRFARACGMEG